MVGDEREKQKNDQFAVPMDEASETHGHGDAADEEQHEHHNAVHSFESDAPHESALALQSLHHFGALRQNVLQRLALLLERIELRARQHIVYRSNSNRMRPLKSNKRIYIQIATLNNTARSDIDERVMTLK